MDSESFWILLEPHHHEAAAVQTDAPALEITVREKEVYLRTDRDHATLQGEDGFVLDVGKKKFAGKTTIVVVELKLDED